METTRIDLLSLVGIPLNRVASTKGGEYRGACPFCGGKDRFWIHPEQGRWYCRQCNPRGGDGVDFIRRRDNCGYREALKALGIESAPRVPIPLRPPKNALASADTDKPAINNPEWQAGAQAFHLDSIEHLASPQGRQARQYLAGRGIDDHYLFAHGIGYNPEKYQAEWGGVPVWLPKGIVIPWVTGNQYQLIRVRPLKPWTEQKYFQPKGCFTGGLFYGDFVWGGTTIKPDSTVILCEGEFDKMAVETALLRFRHWVVNQGKATQFYPRVVALGSASGGRNLENVVELSLAKQVVILTDADEAGDKAATWWLEQLPNAVRVRPTRHDLNDLLILEGWQAVFNLVAEVAK